MKRTQRSQARRALDIKVAPLDLRTLAPPAGGWLRAVRDALGMSTRQLAERIGVASMSISNLEASERAGTAQLDTLRRAADALGCDLVYAFLPRDGFEQSVQRQALARARAEIQRVDRTMRLEHQGLEADELQRRIAEFAAQLVDTRGIWDRPSA